MRLAKVQLVDGQSAVVAETDAGWRVLDMLQLDNVRTLSDILYNRDPAALTRYLIDPAIPAIPEQELRFLPPIDRQEVWAAGVTYRRSQVARMEESEHGASHYDRVYNADRPEIFFKATPHRIAGPGQPLRVRRDSQWSVPEPELVLIISPDGRLIGYTVGNDMSARDIEGENPLYLPQAKVYRQCCGLGPAILLHEGPLDPESTKIELSITRNGAVVNQDGTTLAMLHRKLEDLIDWLFRENEFPQGAFLFTGTGIIPPDNFTLENGDAVSISITGIGTLTNPIVKD